PVGPHAQPAHAGVDLYVNIDGHVSLHGRTIERFNRIQPVNDGGQVILQANILLAFPKTAETKNWLLDSRASEFDAFLWQRYTKPVSPFLLQAACARHGAVSVGVRLHRRQNSYVLSQLVSKCVKIVR